MQILVTAGNTQTPVDRVRCLTNIFTGRTGAQIAAVAAERGHIVTLFTSHPETIVATESLQIRTYRTFDDLHALMSGAIPGGNFDAIVHAAAVGDYFHAGSYALAPGAEFDADNLTWTSATPQLVDVAAGKVKSSHSELWLRFTPAPKLIDLIREPWGFRGILVKFKLEVGLNKDELVAVAEESRRQSQADLMVANTLEGRNEEAFIGAREYVCVARRDLPEKLMERLEGWATSHHLRH
jgi:phosphopantothenate-cysteine ligase/phosphopantothenoylcysteine decarboxylase/phosphopantothenate--cysteine ligase